MDEHLALATALEQADCSQFDALLMPDFYLDHLMQFPSLQSLKTGLAQVGEGANTELQPERQMLRAGGGAVNAAHALARLGVRTHLLAVTSPVGARFLEATLGRDGVDLSLVRDSGHLSVTGAIECSDCSLMLSTPDPGVGLGPESLGAEDWDCVARSEAVFVGGWGNPLALDLSAQVWRVAKQTNGLTYTDPGSTPRDRTERDHHLKALSSQDLDALSVNQHELRGLEPVEDEDAQGLVEAGERLSQRLHARVDLHSSDISASFENGRMIASAPSYDVELHQATGAGDTWNAGVILGDLLELPPAQRLLLANALAALYVESKRAQPPWRDEVVDFLSNRPRQRKAALTFSE